MRLMTFNLRFANPDDGPDIWDNRKDLVARIILEHQELFDGSGYPHGLRGNDISPGARIVSVAEFYDAITSARPHRGGLRHEEALQLVRNNMGGMFDENVCRAFLAEMKQPIAS